MLRVRKASQKAGCVPGADSIESKFMEERGHMSWAGNIKRPLLLEHKPWGRKQWALRLEMEARTLCLWGGLYLVGDGEPGWAPVQGGEWSVNNIDSRVEVGSRPRAGRPVLKSLSRWQIKLRYKFLHIVWTHTQFSNRRFYAFLYRKVHLSLVDMKAESFKKNSLLPLHFCVSISRGFEVLSVNSSRACLLCWL